MKKLLGLTLSVLALLALSVAPASGQEYGVQYTRGVKHITTKTTTNVVAQKAVLYSLVINVSGAGSSWTVTIQDKAGTPDIFYTATVVTGTTVFEFPVGINFTGGIDIVTAGTTAGTMDVWYSYR